MSVACTVSVPSWVLATLLSTFAMSCVPSIDSIASSFGGWGSLPVAVVTASFAVSFYDALPAIVMSSIIAITAIYRFYTVYLEICAAEEVRAARQAAATAAASEAVAPEDPVAATTLAKKRHSSPSSDVASGSGSIDILDTPEAPGDDAWRVRAHQAQPPLSPCSSDAAPSTDADRNNRASTTEPTISSVAVNEYIPAPSPTLEESNLSIMSGLTDLSDNEPLSGDAPLAPSAFDADFENLLPIPIYADTNQILNNYNNIHSDGSGYALDSDGALTVHPLSEPPSDAEDVFRLFCAQRRVQARQELQGTRAVNPVTIWINENNAAMPVIDEPRAETPEAAFEQIPTETVIAETVETIETVVAETVETIETVEAPRKRSVLRRMFSGCFKA
jgi:hypothetical protein